MRLQDRIAHEQLAHDGSGVMKHMTFVQADGAQTYTMKSTERVIYITSGHGDNTMTITLPPVHECAGEIVFIEAVAGGTATTTVEDDGGDATFSNVSLDGNNEFVLLFSTGKSWKPVATAGHN